MNEEQMTYERINITLSPVVIKRLEEITTKQGTTKSGFISMLINDYYHNEKW